LSQNNNDNTGLSVDFGDELSKNLTIHKNVKQEIIITTEDKIKLVLISTKEILSAQRDWVTPFGLLISFIATLITADFKDALGLKKEVWDAIFILLTIASSVWLMWSFYKLYKNWGKDNLDKIIEMIKLKNGSSTADGAIVIEPRKILLDIPIDGTWTINHWASNCASIVGGKMTFVGTTAPKNTDGSYLDLIGMLEVGSVYEVTCFVKSDANTTGKFMLWCHDHSGSEGIKTAFKIPPAKGEIVTLKFKAEKNKNIRIHLEYEPGQGRIEVSDVKIYKVAG